MTRRGDSGVLDEDGSLRRVRAAAPIRICDLGGWTDTWFAGHGRVLNVAVRPCVEVEVVVLPSGGRPDPVTINAESYGDRYSMVPGRAPGRHPLLEAAVEEAGLPPDVHVEINVWSAVPAGAGTGTSASVAVALIAALDALTPGGRTPHEVAYAAHRVETERLGLESGVQDQLCAAHGGVSFIEVDPYPHARVSPVRVPEQMLWELERRLMLVYLGRGHLSSAVHERVVAHLGAAAGRHLLEPLRTAAVRGRDALAAGDLAGFAEAMRDNTRAQAALHPDLVGPEAQRLIELGREHGVVGWKVNGAGGEGGSVTLLCGSSAGAKRALLRALPAADPGFAAIPIALERRGVRVWESSRRRA